jgi:hypothetical protein
MKGEQDKATFTESWSLILERFIETLVLVVLVVFLHIRQDYLPFTPVLEKPVLHPHVRQVACLNDVIVARLL